MHGAARRSDGLARQIAKLRMPPRRISLVPVTKIVGENAFDLRRSVLFVDDPHSRSTSPPLTSAKRFSA